MFILTVTFTSGETRTFGYASLVSWVLALLAYRQVATVTAVEAFKV